MWVTISIGVESTQLLDIGIDNSNSESTNSQVISSQSSWSRVDAACDSWIQLACEKLRTAAHRWTRFILSQHTSLLKSSSVCILDQVPPWLSMAMVNPCRSEIIVAYRCYAGVDKKPWLSVLGNHDYGGPRWREIEKMLETPKFWNAWMEKERQTEKAEWFFYVLCYSQSIASFFDRFSGFESFEDSNSTRAGASGSNRNERINVDDDN